MSKWLVWLRDAGERAAGAFVAGFLGYVALNVFVVHGWDTGRGLLLGAVAAGVIALKSFVASQFGNGASASLQPNLPLAQYVADPPQDPVVQTNGRGEGV